LLLGSKIIVASMLKVSPPTVSKNDHEYVTVGDDVVVCTVWPLQRLQSTPAESSTDPDVLKVKVHNADDPPELTENKVSPDPATAVALF